MLFEEAHNFAEDSAPSPSRSVIEKIAREGRKFHCSLGLISQRPVRLSTTALSQCNTQFILRVTNRTILSISLSQARASHLRLKTRSWV